MSKTNTNTNGALLYDGPSKIDGQRIVVILTGLTRKSANPKTGNMLQVYILRADCSPTEARKAGKDVSVCGDCPHRCGSCYVNIAQGPTAVWCSWKRGGYARYDKATHADKIRGRKIRLGAYGDPAAVPIRVFKPILKLVAGTTGYTHQWRKAIGRPYKALCMASADTVQDAEQAKAKGWRFFLVTPKQDEHDPAAINCPASEEAGKRTSCGRCGLCCGNTKSKAPSVYITAHGGRGQMNAYRLKLLPTLAS